MSVWFYELDALRRVGNRRSSRANVNRRWLGTEVRQMMQCGLCAQQVVQAAPLVAPALWMLAIATVTAVVALGGKKKGKGK
jgi:hypothetical protein